MESSEKRRNKQTAVTPTNRYSLFYKVFIVVLGTAVVPTVAVSLLTFTAYDYLLRPELPEGEWISISQRVLALLLLALIVTIALVIIVAFLFSRRITRPLKLLIEATTNVSKGDLDTRVTIERDDELGTLATRFNEMVEKLRETKERNEVISNLKSRFVSVAAHQLRTPLSAVKWTTKLLLDQEFGTLNPEQQELLENGYTANERMIRLVNDLLNLARIEEGKFEYHFKELPATPLFEKLTNEFTPLADRRGITIQCEREIPDTMTIVADADKLFLALANILDNAVRYNLPNGRVVIRLTAKDDFLNVAVRDTGIGIAPDDADKIFSRFYRGANAVRTETEGSGLGLFLARNIIERHGGTIRFESKEGKGTTFFFTLPLRKELIPEKDPSLGTFLEAI
ncbi:MAG: HAMP domain-containing histidine kinase [Parcubacteria group bacterium]|nr:HAMP domain-containing histidine kinase [Parcubacteria group bacterium]